jgi:hypothetical protein
MLAASSIQMRVLSLVLVLYVTKISNNLMKFPTEVKIFLAWIGRLSRVMKDRWYLTADLMLWRVRVLTYILESVEVLVLAR